MIDEVPHGGGLVERDQELRVPRVGDHRVSDRVHPVPAQQGCRSGADGDYGFGSRPYGSSDEVGVGRHHRHVRADAARELRDRDLRVHEPGTPVVAQAVDGRGRWEGREEEPGVNCPQGHESSTRVPARADTGSGLSSQSGSIYRLGLAVRSNQVDPAFFAAIIPLPERFPSGLSSRVDARTLPDS